MNKTILDKISPFKRNTWLPETKDVPAEHSADDKFCGLPYLRDENDWPRCTNCGKQMQLFIQLDLSRLPEKKGKGLAQFFYCTNNDVNCELACEAWFPNTTSMHARLIEVNGTSAIAEKDILEIYPEKRITSWERSDDYPNYEELFKLGLKLTDDEADEYLEGDFPITGDKLFGWPNWVQGVEYHLPDSELFVQIDSECHVPFMFGDCGCGHVTRKKDDPAEMTFGWACG
jgi:uncharacterized protein YwqG